MAPQTQPRFEYKDGIIYTPEIEQFDESFNGVGDGLFKAMQRYPNNVAEIEAETGRTVKYSHLFNCSVRAAIEMRSRGINNESVVCIYSYNHLDTCIPFIAAQFLGAKTCCLDPTLSKQQITHLIQLTKPNIFFVVSECVLLLEEVLKEIDLISSVVIFGPSKTTTSFDDYMREKEGEDSFAPYQPKNLKETAVILFSSGTTGLPKGICLSHTSFLCKTEVGDLSVILSFTSLYWITGTMFLVFSALRGTARIIAKSFDPDKAWDYIENYKVTFVFLAPILAHEFSIAGQQKKKAVDTNSVKIFFTGGTLIAPKVLHDLRSLLPGTCVYQGYGQTEVGGVSTIFDPQIEEDINLTLLKPTSCGRPTRGVTYKVVDPSTERTLGFNQQGELRVKAKTEMVGYYNMDSSDAWDKDGWLKSGDIVYYDEDFCFYVVDRIKEMLKYKSWHVAPAFIENVILSHPSVKECVVLGIPHDIDGDHPGALVVLKDEAPKHIVPRDILEYTNKRVDERHKLRGGLKFVKHLLYTATGKVRRNDLRDLFVQDRIDSLLV